jgi:hypothetical protein
VVVKVEVLAASELAGWAAYCFFYSTACISWFWVVISCSRLILLLELLLLLLLLLLLGWPLHWLFLVFTI